MAFLARTLRWALAAAILTMPLVAAAQTAVVNRNVNMRSGPDRFFPLVTWLPAGTRVRVFGCTSGWRWCDVASGPNRGWVHSAYLANITRRMPIVTFSIGPYWDSHYRGRPWYSSRSQWDAWNTRPADGDSRGWSRRRYGLLPPLFAMTPPQGRIGCDERPPVNRGLS